MVVDGGAVFVGAVATDIWPEVFFGVVDATVAVVVVDFAVAVSVGIGIVSVLANVNCGAGIGIDFVLLSVKCVVRLPFGVVDTAEVSGIGEMVPPFVRFAVWLNVVLRKVNEMTFVVVLDAADAVADVMPFPGGIEVAVVVNVGELCATRGSWLLCTGSVAELAIELTLLSKVERTLAGGDTCAAEVGVPDAGLVVLWLVEMDVVVVVEPVVVTEMAVGDEIVVVAELTADGEAVVTGMAVDSELVVVRGVAVDEGVAVNEGVAVDKGVVDEGVVDEGVVDEGVVDEGVVDEGVVDEGVVDKGVAVDDGVAVNDGEAVVLGSVSLGIGTIELVSGTGTIELNSTASLARLVQLAILLYIWTHNILLLVPSISPKRTCRAQDCAKKTSSY
jgi:hypothetical protein